MSISAILFDLDGTLVDTERESAEAMARALASGQGVEIDQADRDGIIGHSWIEIFRNLKGKYSQIEWELDRLIAETARIRELMLADTGLEPLPGVLELLDRFSALPKAVVTGSSRAEAEHALELLGIRDQFKALYAAEDVPSSKPDPAGYLQAAEALTVAPGRCVVLEDSAAGIAAGRAAGAYVVAVRIGNFAGQDQSGAHAIVDTLEHVTHELFEGLLG